MFDLIDDSSCPTVARVFLDSAERMSDADDTPTSTGEAQCPAQSLSPPACLPVPANNRTPPCDNDDTSASQVYTPSPKRVDDPAEESFQNPEPPKELADLLNADNIGGTVFSKHWLFTTLMRLLEVMFYVINTVTSSQHIHNADI